MRTGGPSGSRRRSCLLVLALLGDMCAIPAGLALAVIGRAGEIALPRADDLGLTPSVSTGRPAHLPEHLALCCSLSDLPARDLEALEPLDANALDAPVRGEGRRVAD